jgi:hypothetical protein
MSQLTFPVSHVVPVAAPNPLKETHAVALDESLHERVSHIVSLVLFRFENINYWYNYF